MQKLYQSLQNKIFSIRHRKQEISNVRKDKMELAEVEKMHQINNCAAIIF